MKLENSYPGLNYKKGIFAILPVFSMREVSNLQIPPRQRNRRTSSKGEQIKTHKILRERLTDCANVSIVISFITVAMYNASLPDIRIAKHQNFVSCTEVICTKIHCLAAVFVSTGIKVFAVSCLLT